MQDIPSVPSIKPPEVPNVGGGIADTFRTARDIMYSWWFWAGLLIVLTVYTWIVIERRKREGGR